MLDSKTLRLTSIDKNLDEMNEKVAKPIFEKFFDEEFDIDPESPLIEHIEVPDFSDGRRGRYVHDFLVVSKSFFQIIEFTPSFMWGCQNDFLNFFRLSSNELISNWLQVERSFSRALEDLKFSIVQLFFHLVFEENRVVNESKPAFIFYQDYSRLIQTHIVKIFFISIIRTKLE